MNANMNASHSKKLGRRGFILGLGAVALGAAALPALGVTGEAKDAKATGETAAEPAEPVEPVLVRLPLAYADATIDPTYAYTYVTPTYAVRLNDCVTSDYSYWGMAQPDVTGEGVEPQTLPHTGIDHVLVLWMAGFEQPCGFAVFTAEGEPDPALEAVALGIEDIEGNPLYATNASVMTGEGIPADEGTLGFWIAGVSSEMPAKVLGIEIKDGAARFDCAGYYTVTVPSTKWPIEFSFDFDTINSISEGVVSAHSLIITAVEEDSPYNWAQFFGHDAGMAGDGPTLFGDTEVTTSDGLLVGVCMSYDFTKALDEEESQKALDEYVAMVSEPLPAEDEAGDAEAKPEEPTGK